MEIEKEEAIRKKIPDNKEKSNYEKNTI